MSASLVGSEMCIRDRPVAVVRLANPHDLLHDVGFSRREALRAPRNQALACLLYTSDAADDM
eukprot:800488-Alexandrium_andersonii.AAC.1